MKSKMDMMPNTPIRLAMNAGVSLQEPLFYRDTDRHNALENQLLSGSVSGVGIISSKRK